MRDYIKDLLYIAEHPRLFLAEYFQNMRSELDAEYCDEKRANLAIELKEDYLLAIEEIYNFEKSLSKIRYDPKEEIDILKSAVVEWIEEFSTNLLAKIFNNRSIFLYESKTNNNRGFVFGRNCCDSQESL